MPEPRTGTQCECAALPDFAMVPMGGDGRDERVFAALDTQMDHGGEPWWLHLARCSLCGTFWMIAQEERIYDIHLLKRLGSAEADAIINAHRWPDDFLTYERVLGLCRRDFDPCIFLDPASPALVDTIADLRRARADIMDGEIAHLLGIEQRRVSRLGRSPRATGGWWSSLRRMGG